MKTSKRKLNGDAKFLSMQITQLEKNRGEDHRANEKRFDLLFKKLDIVVTNATNITWLTWSHRTIWAVLIIGGIITIAVKLLSGGIST